MNIPSFLPEAPMDQPYLCPHCQRTFYSYRSPRFSEYTRPAIVQQLTVDNTRLTCGEYRCWEQEVDAHSEFRIAFFQKYRKAKTPPPPQKDLEDGY